MVLPSDVQRRLQEFIERYDLHRRYALPVPIEAAAEAEGFEIRLTPRLWPLNGFAITIGPVRRMEINADLSPAWRRWVIAHELAHLILGDPSVLHLCAAEHALFSNWLRKRIERRANHAAAYLLIPEWVVREIDSPEEIAASCHVPTSLAVLRLIGQIPSSHAQHPMRSRALPRRRRMETVWAQHIDEEVCHV